ncbi:MAG: hypothetical protein RIQ60_2608 [Pseudomonadota bacterium]|jgi:hypothetical protein
MATNKQTAPARAPARPLPLPLPAATVASPGSVLVTLYEAAARHLSPADLQTVAGAVDVVDNVCRRASTLAEGLGCLIASDADSPEPRSGALQDPAEVARVLWLMGNLFDLVGGLNYAATRASERLTNSAANEGATS